MCTNDQIMHNVESYEEAQSKVSQLLENGCKFILLYGTGGNGKSKLLESFEDRAIIHHEFDIEQQKNQKFDKPIIAASWNCPEEDYGLEIINMNSVKF